ncbi:MAG: hypothetical protein MZV64_70530 [Ignavibacteriales bacterium]|nr:hypothetical protein [Ignavibacteriales bacterium]
MPTYWFVAEHRHRDRRRIDPPLGAGGPVPDLPAVQSATLVPLTTFLILRAFSAGCTALTGIEAVANCVQAFRPPETRNAGITLIWMAAMLGSMFLGLAVSERRVQPSSRGKGRRWYRSLPRKSLAGDLST